MSWSEKVGEALAGLGFLLVAGVIGYWWVATPAWGW